MTTLTKDDFNAAAEILGCEAAAVQAVAEVETSGSGFLPDGRPNILFEAKTFHRLTNGMYDESHSNISSPTWDRTLYGKSGAHQWDRLNLATTLNRSAALQSASWGAFQIMGENFHRCGYASIDAFVSAMRDGGESAHLMAFVHFVMADPKMLAAIRERKWMEFARLYNGPSYAENDYHTKLANAYTNALSTPSV